MLKMHEDKLNDLIDAFVNVFNNDIKQRDKDWFKLMGTTIGGSEIAAIMGLNPHSSFYKIVESKIDICKGVKTFNVFESVACTWGLIFEDIISRIVEIDIGNKVKGGNICIQKYEGHRNSPDGYVVAHFYYKNDSYHLWTTDMDKDIIILSLIMLVEFKCPITRKTTSNIPKYYKPQLLSGLSVSPLAHKGLFIDATFKKCSLDQLGYNPYYDTIFHKNSELTKNPIVWGTINICFHKANITDGIKNIYKEYFKLDFDDTDDNIIDLGDVSYDIFNTVLFLLNDHQLTSYISNIQFFDGRGSDLIEFDENIDDYITFAIFPWKLFDLTYIPIDREPNFLEDIYPIIKKVHEIVKDSVENNSYEKIKIINICNMIYD